MFIARAFCGAVFTKSLLHALPLYAFLLKGRSAGDASQTTSANLHALQCSIDFYKRFFDVCFVCGLLHAKDHQAIVGETVRGTSRDRKILVHRQTQQQRAFCKEMVRAIGEFYSLHAADTFEEVFSVDRDALIESLKFLAEEHAEIFDRLVTERTLLRRFAQTEEASMHVPPLQPLQPRKTQRLPFGGAPFLLTAASSNRERAAKSVFGPSHSLPTMSIDEYLAAEVLRGGILPAASSSSAKSLNGPSCIEEDDVAAYDAVKIYKERSFDAFKDENKRGAGNRMNYG